MQMSARPTLLFAVAISVAGGCGAGTPSSASSPNNIRDLACRPLTATAPSPAAVASPFKGTVFTIVIENKSRDLMLKEAPYFSSLAHEYTIANGYVGVGLHPSEPNYIWMVAGQNFGIVDDSDPVAHHIASTSHLVDQLEAAGRTWKAYEESMGEPCGVVTTGLYAAKHDPFVYFDDVVGWVGNKPARSQRCREHVVDYSQLAADLASGHMPDYAFITPNMTNDMHNGTIAQGDAWFAREVPKILASPAFKNGGVLFITADEGEEGGGRDQPPFIVVSPLAKRHYVSNAHYSTSEFLKTVEAILGVEALPCGVDPAGTKTMDDLFTVPLPAF